MLLRAALVSRRLLPRPSIFPSSQQLRHQYRRYSQQSRSPTGEFYKTFTRPVAKCLLLALLTYQIVYWGWVRLEQDEIRAERQAEIAMLESQVHELQTAAKEQEKPQEELKAVKKGWWPF